MLPKLIISSLVVLLSVSGQSNGQTIKNAVNYLGIQGPVSLQKNVFKLVWSSHPEATFFKQEYLAGDDAFPKYKSMITIDFVVTDSKIDQAVKRKIQELDQLRKTNFDVNYEVISNAATGEKIIDCLIVQTAQDEQSDLAERDIFRYKTVKAKSGEQGIFLLAVSTRKYGKEIKPFLLKLKTDRPVLVKEVAQFPIPALNISKQY